VGVVRRHDENVVEAYRPADSRPVDPRPPDEGGDRVGDEGSLLR
jgi:hypothetical protein